MLTAAQYQRLKEFFSEADSLGPTERERVAERAEQEDPSIGAALRRMLDAENAATSFLDGPLLIDSDLWPAEDSDSGRFAWQGWQALADSEAAPTRIGQYAVERRIGIGGMGAVYEARQERPLRMVAVKVIRTGLATSSAVRRFQFEADVLAQLEHPYIARIYDAGMAEVRYEDGESVSRPFLAMEYVRGQPLGDYVRDSQVGTRAQLELLAKVCDAVHHAHQKGVIHRDLKPGNILVDGDHQPKILDFGVARATDGDLQRVTVQTEVGQLVGTIPYMSPEQLRGQSAGVDTRSDVYTLGVILYELLAGRLPHDVRGCSVGEAVQRIESDEPLRLASISASCRGDLETIVHKALEKEAERRYQSAAELSADLRRHLADEPIMARPASAVYQIRKFSKRNKALVGGFMVAVLALAAGAAVATWQAVRATSEAERASRAEEQAREHQEQAEDRAADAELARDEAEAVLTFLTDTLMSANPEDLGREVQVTDVLARASETADAAWADRPLVASRIHEALGGVYLTLGKYAPAEEHLDLALTICDEELGPNHVRTAGVGRVLGMVYSSQGRLEEAEAVVRQALEVLEANLGAEHADTLTCLGDLASVASLQRRFEEAESLYREVIAGCEQVSGPEAPDTLEHRRLLGAMLDGVGRFEEAVEILEPTVDALRRTLGDDHPRTLKALRTLAGVYTQLRRFDEAEEHYVTTLDAMKRVYGPEHSQTLQLMNNLAVLYTGLGRSEDAARTYAELIGPCQRTLGPEHRYALLVRANLGFAYTRLGRLEEAEPLLVEALEAQQRVLGERDYSVAGTLRGLAELRVEQGDYVTAEERYAEAAEIFEETTGPDDVQAAMARTGRADCLRGLERYEEAEAEFQRALESFQSRLSNDHPFVQDVINRMMILYTVWGRPEEAERYRALLEGKELADETKVE